MTQIARYLGQDGEILEGVVQGDELEEISGLDPMLQGGRRVGELMERLSVIYGAWMLAPGFPFTVREIAVDEVVRLAEDIELSECPVPHTLESVAYSIRAGSQRLVYTGDTGYDEGLSAWARGCGGAAGN